MTARERILGPGTIRVGRFIGRLGVVSTPAISAGLDLDERVVRRHVAKLEESGWLVRERWVRGEGSITWLTGTGIEAAGLGGLRPVKAPPSPTLVAHSILVAWSAARLEHRRRVWQSSRQLAIEPERWAITVKCERGYTKLLPDLAVWLEPGGPPMALVADSGHRREDRQKWILEAWRDAIIGGQYAGLRYDCETDGATKLIRRLAKKVALAGNNFGAFVQTNADEIAALPVTPRDPDDSEACEPEPAAAPPDRTVEAAPVEPAASPTAVLTPREEPREPEPGTPEQSAERERHYRELFGMNEPKRRRRWRR